MADNPQTLSAVLSALAQNFRPRVVRTINRRSVLLKTLPIQAGEGKNIAVDVEFDGMVVENFNDGDDVVNYGSDAVAPATLAWGLYRSNFRVGDLARAAAKTSKSPQGLMALWGRNMVNASAKLASQINLGGYSGNGTSNAATGMDLAFQNANTYMGIDRTQLGNAGFRGNVIDPGVVTQVALDDIRGDINNTIYTACGEQPDLAFCSPTIFNMLGGRFTQLRRFPDAVREIVTARGKTTLDASVGALEFEGCVFIKDKDATANQIYYVNSNYVHWEYLPQQDEGPLTANERDADLDDGFGPVPLGMRTKMLAETGASKKATAMVFLNLVVEKPNTCGLRKNVANT